jgi:hypothetical protein
MFPSGRARLATRLASIESRTETMTMGIVVVARQGPNGQRGDRQQNIGSETDKFNRERREALRLT